MYKIGEFGKVDEKFTGYFGVSFRKFHDSLSSAFFGSACIDLIKFDEWLHEKHGEYEKGKMSMASVIKKYYGEDASKFIEELL